MRRAGEALVQALTEIVNDRGDVGEAKLEEILEVSREAREAQQALRELFFST